MSNYAENVHYRNKLHLEIYKYNTVILNCNNNNNNISQYGGGGLLYF